MLQDIFEKYKEEICSVCKGNCTKGICIVYGKCLEVQCVDYEKDETKIKAPPEKLINRAKKQKPLMRNIV